jgi:hypothetical protein
MNSQFKALVANLEAKYQYLMAMNPAIAASVPTDTPRGGVYLFTESGNHLYVGRTKRQLGTRIREHFSTAKDCPFAWLIARSETGKKATYTKAGSRAALLSDVAFTDVYDRAKARISNMHVRYVHEPDPLRQALLEIYVAVVTGAKYNDFDTH